MNRKLHNTLMAVIASSSLLTLGLIAGTPVMPSMHDAVAPSSFASLNGVEALQDRTSRGSEESPAAPRPGRTRSVRGSGQSVSMPFFSFVPRG